MLGTAVLASIAQQMMSSNAVDVNGKPVPVSRTSGHRLRTLPFTMDGREYQAHRTECREAEPMGATGAGGASGCPVQGRGYQQICGGRG